ncbi:MAG: hypothetical protein DIZ78_05140 [endosymbiont of Escarpia spicata]|uniref:Uncharacterized protein n=1 Tax=endosymbiont of Escarpia spicata TaxID=2200908 RepID=A0A370DTN7_9GAMM|nr:MAG: hypothetical protein DIZ78_05140 [endosymbiont of Escarpia spicata]
MTDQEWPFSQDWLQGELRFARRILRLQIDGVRMTSMDIQVAYERLRNISEQLGEDARVQEMLDASEIQKPFEG